MQAVKPETILLERANSEEIFVLFNDFYCLSLRSPTGQFKLYRFREHMLSCKMKKYEAPR